MKLFFASTPQVQGLWPLGTLFLQPNSISFVFGGKIEKLLLLVWSYWMEVTIFLPVILISHRKAQSDIVANYWLRVL
jgi:hypothetical protein